MAAKTIALANAVPGITVRSVEEAWAYLILRRAELEGRIFGLRYEPCRFNLGATSSGRQSTYTPDFWYVDDSTHELVAMEIVGFRKRERARGDALLRAAFPWIRFEVVDGKLLKDPRKATGVDPIFGLPLPITLHGVVVSVATGALARKARAKFLRTRGREAVCGEYITLTARESGGEEPVTMFRGPEAWERALSEETVAV